jgi:hypothetical protein
MTGQQIPGECKTTEQFDLPGAIDSGCNAAQTVAPFLPQALIPVVGACYLYSGVKGLYDIATNPTIENVVGGA